MPARSERKARLDKGGGGGAGAGAGAAPGGFIGFSAFATTGNSSSASSAASASVSAAAAGGQQKQGKLGGGGGGPAPSPVFTGSDVHLHQLFRRIGQKKDATTRVRALGELADYAFLADPKSSKQDEGGVPSGLGSPAVVVSRQDKIAALSHLIYLSLTKLLWDNAPTVRCQTMSTLQAARDVVPKAWKSLVLYGAPPSPNTNAEQSSGIAAAGTTMTMLPNLSFVTVAAMAHAMRTDPSTEVSSAAKQLMKCIEEDTTTSGTSAVQCAVLNYTIQLLTLTNADALDGAVFGGGKGGGGGESSSAYEGGGKSKNKKDRGNRQQQQKQSGRSDAEREESEERYERTVLSALGGLSLLVQQSPEPDEEDNNESWKYAALIARDIAGCTSLWRYLTSSRSPFRRATYSLLSDLAQRAPSLLHRIDGTAGSSSSEMEVAAASSKKNKALPNLVPSVLTNERDPGNVTKMLDFILSYIASFLKSGTDNAWNSEAGGIDSTKTVSALAKLFRRGCHGSPAVAWSPIVLPLVACLPKSGADKESDSGSSSNALQIKILAALWEGKDSAGGGPNEAAVVTAVVETATFLLLRRSGDESTEDGKSTDEAKEIAQYVFQTLEYYLGKSEDERRDSITALEDLRSALCRDLQRLDAAADDADGRTDCILYAIRAWFWTDGGVRRVIVDGTQDDKGVAVARLGELVRLATTEDDATSDGNASSARRLPPILRDSVSGITSPLLPSENPPNQAQINLLLEVMKFCGVTYTLNKVNKDLAESAAVVESYISSALVGWIVTLFSSSSISSKSSRSRVAYIKILRLCLESMSSVDSRRRIWASALKDMVNAHVDLSFLTMTITVIAKSGDANVVKCDTLDEFATQVGEAASMVFRTEALSGSGISEENVHAEESRSSMHLLLQTFVGLSTGCSQVLVEHGVVQSWLDAACQESEQDMILEDSDGRNTLLDVLLAMAEEGDPYLSYSNLLRAAMQSWKEGGKIWTTRCLRLPKSHRDRQRVLSELEDCAKDSLKQDLVAISVQDDAANGDRICRVWSNRCSRLFHLCPNPGLDLVGLDNVQLWASSYASQSQELGSQKWLYFCLKNVLQGFDDPSQRRQLLCGDTNKAEATNTELILHVLLSLANAIPSQVPCANTVRHYQCFELLALIGDLPRDYLLSLCRQAIGVIANEMKEAGACKSPDHSSAQVINRSVAILDLLGGKLFGRHQVATENNSADDEVSPQDVKEGDELFYVSRDDNNVAKRVKCRVAKIHTDDYPNLYFTIHTEGEDGQATERQTVAARLKKRAMPPKEPASGSREIEEGVNMTAMLVDRIIKPYLSSYESTGQPAFVAEAAAECCSIAISRFGLGAKSGLGSVRYDVFQIVSSLERKACDALSSADTTSFENATSSLRCLALALGFGKFVQASPATISILKLTSRTLIDAIHQAANSIGKTKQMSVAVLMWLSVALSATTDGETFRLSMSVLEKIASKLLQQSNAEEDFVLMLRAFGTVQKQAHCCMDYSSADTAAERQTLSILIKTFAATAVDETKSADAAPRQHWLDQFSSLIRYNLTRDGGAGISLLSGARQWNEALCDTLFSPAKRWCSYQLLTALAKERRELNPGGQLSEDSRRRVKLWKAKLDSEEAQELQDDATGASRWLPECAMNVVEGWAEMSEEDRASEDEEEAFGKLLTWLVCLNFLDNAAAVDIRNRSAVTSYLDKASAVGEVLMTANRYANLADKETTWMNSLEATKDGEDSKDSMSLFNVATLVVFRTIESVPTLAKKWWMDDCSRSIQPQVNDFVQKRVAPETLRRELSRINDAKDTFGEMTVRGSCVSREVTATYVQDECTLSVLITVPPSFPLRNAEVDCKKTLGIPEKRWRRWGLQITRMLNHEDGSILDALLLWKQNVDKEFEGIEPCPVCYSVLCVKTHTMPNLECKTCDNRFHSSCLMKWFQSSGKSQCVLCQQPWSGSKVST